MAEILTFEYDHKGRPRFMLGDLQVWPDYWFRRSGEAEKIKGRRWKISQRMADDLRVNALRRAVMGDPRPEWDWWTPQEYDAGYD